MRDYLKSWLIVAAIFSFSLFGIGYAQNFFPIQLVADFVHAIGFGPKSVGEFILGWLIIALPNVVCGVIVGRSVPVYRLLYLAPLVILVLWGVSGYMYLQSKEFIWVCDAWNLLFVTALVGFIVGGMKRKAVARSGRLPGPLQTAPTPEAVNAAQITSHLLP